MSSPSFTEKSSTEWFYQIRGEGARHGLVNEVILSHMATEGRLKPTDLVWNKTKGDQWIPASTIPGLRPIVEAPRPSSAQPKPADALISKRHRSSFPILLVVGAILVSFASWICPKIRSGEQVLPAWVSRLLGIQLPAASGDALYVQLISLCLDQEKVDKAKDLIITFTQTGADTPAVVQQLKQRLHEVCAAIAQRERLRNALLKAQALVEQEQVAEAEPLVRQLAESAEHRRAAVQLNERIRAIREEQTRRIELERALRNGALDAASARELVNAYSGKNRLDALFTLTDGVLRSTTNLTPASVLSVARVYIAMEKPTLAKAMLQQFASLAAAAQPADCLQAAKLCRSLGETAACAAILEKYVARVADDTDALIELAALKAQAGQEDSALDHLKRASKLNEARVREKASDPQFDSIRDTWTFRRLAK
ncbi:MAG: DUF4339 domain-containing protein [Verrucomicrobiota bacterium]|nr:DUF4339 domain-containing protein [Verrucomicrobiota bacterium]